VRGSGFGVLVLVLDNDAGDDPRAERHDDARADGGNAHAFGDRVSQQIEIRNWNGDAYQHLRGELTT
jgi:hypothetical protein